MPTEFWSSGDPWLCLFVRLRCSYRGSETVKLLEVKSCKLFRSAVLAVCVLMWLSLNGFGTAVKSCQVASRRTSAWLLSPRLFTQLWFVDSGICFFSDK